MSSDEGDSSVSDSTLLSIIRYVGIPVRDSSGAITGVDYNRKDSYIALHELGKLLQEEESRIRSYEKEESRIEEPRSVFVRVSSWRIPTKILIPLFLFLDLSETTLLGRIIYIFIALLIPPPKHTASMALNHKLISETRMLFSSFGIQNKLRQLLVHILKNRNSRRLNGDEVRVLTGFLELVVSLIRLPDGRLPTGAPSRTTDEIVSTMSEVRILELLPQIIQQNDFYLNGSADTHPSFTQSQRLPLPSETIPVPVSNEPNLVNDSVGYTQLNPQDTQLEILPETLISQIEDVDEVQKLMLAPTFRLNQQDQDAQIEETQLTMMDTQLPNILSDSLPETQQPIEKSTTEEIETEDSNSEEEDEEEEESNSNDDEVHRKRKGGKEIISNELKRAKLTEAAAERILEGMNPDLDDEEAAQLEKIQKSGPAEVEDDIEYWNQLVIEIINYLYRRQDMSMLTSASRETVNQTCSHTLSQALTDSLNSEKRTRAMQHPKLNGTLGKQGFFTRNNKIVRAEVLTRGGIVDARERVTRNRLHREEDTSKYTIRVQGILGRFLSGFLDAAGMVLIQHSIPKVLNKIHRQDDFENSYSDEQIDFSIKFYSFTRILLSYCRATAVATNSLIDLSEVSSLLQEEVFFRAFDLSLSMIQQEVPSTGEGSVPTRDVINQKKQSHHVCISFLKECFVILSSLLETYKPKKPSDVPDARFTATKALAASVLHRRDNIQMIIRFLKEHEVFKYPYSYRNDLIQLSHVVLVSLGFISRGGKIYVQKKSRKKKKKTKRKSNNKEQPADDESMPSIHSDVDHSEASSSVYSEWTVEEEIGVYNEQKSNRQASRAFHAEWNRANRYEIHSVRDTDVFTENLLLKEKPGLAMLYQAAPIKYNDSPSQESDTSENPSNSIDLLYYSTLNVGEICPKHVLKDIKKATRGEDNDDSDASNPANRFLEQDAQSTDDSSDSIATVYEDREIDLKGILYEFVQPRVLQTYIDCLKEWKINSEETNGCICHFLMRVAFELKLSPCVLSVECLAVYEEILQSIQVMSADESLRHLVHKKYQLLKETCEKLVRKWIFLFKKHDYWGVLSLGWVTRYEADIIQDGSLFSEEVQRVQQPEEGEQSFHFDNLSGDEMLGEAAHFDTDVDPEIRARAAAWRAKRWGPEDDIRLKQVWEQFLENHGDGFVGDIKSKVFKEKTFSAKAILEKAISLGLVVPSDVAALPAPKAKWTKDLEESLRDNFGVYSTGHPQGDDCLVRLREDLFPMFAEDQILRKAKALGIEEATAIQEARKKATATRAAAARRKKREDDLELTRLLEEEDQREGDDENEVVPSRKSKKSKKEKKNKKEKKSKKEKKEKKSKREKEKREASPSPTLEEEPKKRSRVEDE